MEGRVFEKFPKNQKKIKISKMPKIVPKSVQTCFELVLGYFYRKKNFAQYSMNGRDFENFQKKSDQSKLIRLPTKAYVKC